MLATLSLKLFMREIRSGYLTSMLLSLVLAVTIVSGISLFTDRLEKVLSSETQEFLGGDLKFESNDTSIKAALQSLNLKDSKSSEMAILASVIFSEEEMQLSSIKAVDNSYPLIGELELENGSGTYKTKESPKPGNLWMDERLKNLLALEYGDEIYVCLLYTSPSPRDSDSSRMPSSA